MKPTPSTRTFISCFLLLLAAAPSSMRGDDAVNLGAMFGGSWSMEGRFRHTPEMDWIPTGSKLVAAERIAGSVVVRDIEAPQIDFSALDLITHNPRTGAVQYLYISGQDTSALIFEGTCTDDCRKLELEQVCGPAWQGPACNGRTSITFETEGRFVARDTRPGPDGEPFMTREVYYTREEPAAPDPSMLMGTWRLDLRPTPDAEPYYQTLVIEDTGDGIQGTFYGAAFRDFRSNADWTDLRFAFVTEDGSGVYHTTGRLTGDTLEGTTHSLGRGFLSVWSAERSPMGSE